jgi:ATP-dependent DNA helicase RecG
MTISRIHDSRLVHLVDELCQLSRETEWVEFKRNFHPPQMIGEYISALANAACLKYKPKAYLLYGIQDRTHAVVGTSFDPYTEKGKGNQDLLPWVTAGLSPNPGFEVHIVEHSSGRVVIFEINPARDTPVSFRGESYIRIGTSKTNLKQHLEKARAIWTRGDDWSAEICEDATVDDLDPEAVAKAREQFAIKHPLQADDVTDWDDITLLNKARVLKQGKVTRTALLLLGRAESATLLSPAVAKISWILKDADNRELDYEHLGPPFLLAGDRLQNRIRNLNVRAMPSGTLFPVEFTQYDFWVIREALHNCIAHQDYQLRGRIIVVEFPDRVILSNVGDFLPGDVETVIRQDAPQSIYRNAFLADAMVELNLIDTQGGGIKRMFETQRKRSFPLPDYDLITPGFVTVSLNGRILDERYTRLLLERTDIGLEQVMLLDRVQKGLPIEKSEHRSLKSAGLVEGRYPNLIVADVVAKATDTIGEHILESGFDNQYYRDLILKLVREHGPVSRKDIDETLLTKLPDRLNLQQKRTKIRNLMQRLRISGNIVNQGTRKQPAWTILKALDD